MYERELTNVKPPSPRPYLYEPGILEKVSWIEDLSEALERVREAA